MIIIAPQSNTPTKSDATGAFQPEAQAFDRLQGHTAFHLFDNRVPMGDRRASFLRMLGTLSPTSRGLAAYCHGWPRGVQFGFLLSHADLLARALVKACVPATRERPLIVNLACCDTARDTDDDRVDDIREDGPGGIGGFADVLCTRLAAQGAPCRVFAHASLGHTTTNPYVRVFDSTDEYPQGGPWVVPPSSSLFRRWRAALRDTNLRHRFCLMSHAEIEHELTLPVA